MKWLAIVTVILSSSGCAATKKTDFPSERNRVISIYLQAMGAGRIDAVKAIKENLKISKSFGYVQPYVPVVEQPDVRAIFLPAHKSKYDPNTLVSGHWVYVMVRGPRWFIDTQTDQKGKIPVIVPYKEKIK